MVILSNKSYIFNAFKDGFRCDVDATKHVAVRMNLYNKASKNSNKQNNKMWTTVANQMTTMHCKFIEDSSME